jgi:hypothetical protein
MVDLDQDFLILRVLLLELVQLAKDLQGQSVHLLVCPVVVAVLVALEAQQELVALAYHLLLQELRLGAQAAVVAVALHLLTRLLVEVPVV